MLVPKITSLSAGIFFFTSVIMPIRTGLQNWVDHLTFTNILVISSDQVILNRVGNNVNLLYTDLKCLWYIHLKKKKDELTGSNHMGLNLFASSLSWSSYAYLIKSAADLKMTEDIIADSPHV